MIEPARYRVRELTALIFLPTFIVVFLAMRAAWLAYVATLNESQLHLIVFDHAVAIGIALTTLSLALALLISWIIARYVVMAREPNPPTG